MTIVAIKRRGLGEVVNGYTPDTDKQRIVYVDPKLSELADRIRELEGIRSGKPKHEKEFTDEFVPKIILTPIEIKMLAWLAERIEGNQPKGVFISALIQRSYDAGYNDFELLSTSFNRLCRNLQGSQARPLRVSAEDVAKYFGSRSSYVHMRLRDAGEGLGYKSYDSKLSLRIAGQTAGGWVERCEFVLDRAYRSLGVGSRESSFIVLGNCFDGDLANRSVDSTYLISGDISYDFAREARSCTFKSPNLEIAREMKEEAPAGNQVYHIDNGVEVLL
jgi:hypothetical protein